MPPMPEQPRECGLLRDAMPQSEPAAARGTAPPATTPDALAARAAALGGIIEALSDGIMLFERDGRLAYANKVARTLLDIRDDVLPLDLRQMNGQPLPEEIWPWRRVLADAAQAEPAVAEVLAWTRAGQERLLHVSGAPVYDAAGRLCGAAAIIHDETERDRTQQRTQRALDALLAMAETLVAGDSADRDATPSHSGAAKRLAELTCRVLGCARVSIHTIEPDSELMHPLAVVGMPAEMERIWWQSEGRRYRLRDRLGAESIARLEAGEALVFDLTLPPYVGVSNWYNIITLLVAPMRLGDHLVGVLALDYDRARHTYTPNETRLAQAAAKLVALVIERDRLQREREDARASALALREANRQMDEFLSMASHELRNPLTSIKATMQLARHRIERFSARAEPADGETAMVLASVRDVLQRGDRQVDLLDRLVGDLLDVARIHSGKLEVRPVHCDLASIARDAVAEQRMAQPDRVISLKLPPEEHVPVFADADRIGQVITNYLTNAIKYSREDKPVAVWLEVHDGRARLCVRDEGPGLPPEEHERIWGRFHRVPSTVAYMGLDGGLGLGLHISRTLVERSGGVVGVASAHGQGATFWFELPLALGAA